MSLGMNETTREGERKALGQEKSKREGGVIDMVVELRRPFISIWSLFPLGGGKTPVCQG